MNQSFHTVFVTNTSTLLASGATVDKLGVGQVGILDAKTYKGVTAPTYANQKALKLVWGTPDLGETPLLTGTPNENIYSHLIKGKAIKGFFGVKSKPGQQEIVTIGFSGDTADTETLSAKAGEQKHLFVTLTGGPIDKKFSKQGVTRKYQVQIGSIDDCTADPCATVDPRLVAQEFVKQINNDAAINRFVEASVLTTDAPSVTTDTDYRFKLEVCDTRDDVALGAVQAQYPNDVVKRTGIAGSLSVYEVIKDTNSAPADFTTGAVSLIPNCDTCPSGYTLVDYGFAYKITREDAGDSTALTTLKTDYGIAASSESASRVNYEFGTSTYIVVSDTKITSATGQDNVHFIGDAASACVLTTPVSIAWQADGTLTKQARKFRLTIGDTVCGDDRLTDLQAAFPSLTVVLVAESSGTCVHTYETTVYSNRYETGCAEPNVKFVKPQAFEGVNWEEVSPSLGSSAGVLAGIQLKAKYTHYVADEVTYAQWNYDADAVHITASEFDQDYHNTPERSAKPTFKVRKIQAFKQPIGIGAQVRKAEELSKGYSLHNRSFDPVVRQIEGYEFQAKPDVFYDEYVLEFDFEYKTGGWTEKYQDSHKVHVFFPSGQGKSFESAVNGYLASANVNIDPVVL